MQPESSASLGWAIGDEVYKKITGRDGKTCQRSVTDSTRTNCNKFGVSPDALETIARSIERASAPTGSYDGPVGILMSAFISALSSAFSWV